MAPAFPAAAGDLGIEAVFPSPLSSLQMPGIPLGRALAYDSGESAPILEPWDSVLFHGNSKQPQLVFEISRSDVSGRWSEWTKVEVKRFDNGRFWGKATFELGPGAVRIRATARGWLSRPVEVYGVEAFSSSERSPAPQGRQAPLSDPIPRPGVYSRIKWRAGAPREPYAYHVPVRITLHHSAGSYPQSEEESLKEVLFIQDYHQNGRNWSDIAYHFLIDSHGRIFEGRPETVEGAHTQDNNPGNIGIALLGTHHPPKNNALTPLENEAIVNIGRYLVAQYDIDPESLRGHRDYRPTNCPGDIAYALMGSLRREFGRGRAMSKIQKKAEIDWGQVQQRAILHKALGVSTQIMSP